MSASELETQINRFKVNEERLNTFVNVDGFYTTSSGVQVPTLLNVSKRIEASVENVSLAEQSASLEITRQTDLVIAASTSAQEEFLNEDSKINTLAKNTIAGWQTAITTITQTEGIPALAVSTANNETQQDINDSVGAKWYAKGGGYPINYRVMLDNGDIVKSTVANNIINPNVDMIGWVKTNDASQIFDKSGLTQQKINDLTLTPYHFGAIGDGVYHKLSEKYTTLADAKKKYPTAQSLDDSIDLCALESFFSHCKSDSGFNADCSIKAWVNRPLILVGDSPSYEFKTNVINGDLTLINNQNDYDITHFMQINAVGIEFTGKLTLIGNDINLPKDRKQHGGLVLGDGEDDGSAGRITINSVAASGFRDFGTALINGCIFPSIRTQHYRDIGAIGMGGEDNKNKHSANITRVSDVKSVDYEQRTTLSVDSLPPLPDFDYHIYQTMCKFDGDDGIYIITDVDRTAKTITVYPCLNFKKTYTKANYIYGIGMSWSGNNSGCGTFGRLQSILCGVGFWGASLFGGTINYLSTEFCGVGFTLGYRKTVTIGYEISNSYFEGNVFDYVQQWANDKQYPLLNLNNSQGINLDKIAELFSYRIEFYYASEGGYRSQDNFRKNKIFVQNRSYEQKDAITNTLDLGLPDDVVFVKNNGSDISLIIGSGSKLGFNKKTVIIVGDGVNNSPQSNIRITAPSGYALNGGSELILNTNKSAITATVTYDAFSRVITLSSDALYTKAGASTQRPNNAPTGFLYIDVTLDADGKPIWWSGTNWIDATGAIV